VLARLIFDAFARGEVTHLTKPAPSGSALIRSKIAIENRCAAIGPASARDGRSTRAGVRTILQRRALIRLADIRLTEARIAAPAIVRLAIAAGRNEAAVETGARLRLGGRCALLSFSLLTASDTIVFHHAVESGGTSMVRFRRIGASNDVAASIAGGHLTACDATVFCELIAGLRDASRRRIARFFGGIDRRHRRVVFDRCITIEVAAAGATASGEYDEYKR